MAEPIQEFKQAVYRGDVAELGRLFTENPGLRAHIDDPLFDFDTPAIVHAAHGKREIADALLDLGADMNARSSWWAGSFGVLDNWNRELAMHLIGRGARVDAHAAARHGLIDELKRLLKANPELARAPGGDGQTPLHVCASVEAAEILLAHGADIDALDVDHESTPAQYLVRSHPEVVQFLVQRGCRTDILLASATGRMDLVCRHLAENPESIRTRVDNEWFPMRNPRAGGTIYIWTLGFNRTAHQVAKMFGHPEVLDYLLEHTPRDMRVLIACLIGNEAQVRELLQTESGEIRELALAHPEFLTAAAQDCDVNAIRLLLTAGWPVVGDGKHTPLHWACYRGHAASVRALIESGAPLEHLDVSHQGTPLGWAIYGSQFCEQRDSGDYGAVVGILLDAGAKSQDPNQGSPEVRRVLAARRPG